MDKIDKTGYKQQYLKETIIITFISRRLGFPAFENSCCIVVKYRRFFPGMVVALVPQYTIAL
jgi:hypothetical protein